MAISGNVQSSTHKASSLPSPDERLALPDQTAGTPADPTQAAVASILQHHNHSRCERALKRLVSDPQLTEADLALLTARLFARSIVGQKKSERTAVTMAIQRIALDF